MLPPCRSPTRSRWDITLKLPDSIARSSADLFIAAWIASGCGGGLSSFIALEDDTKRFIPWIRDTLERFQTEVGPHGVTNWENLNETFASDDAVERTLSRRLTRSASILQHHVARNDLARFTRTDG